MRVTRTFRNLVIVGATAAAFIGGGAGAALADPPAGTTPAATDISGVGSDTITPLFAGSPTENSAGAFQADYNATSPASKLWSFDAVDTSGASHGPITTKPGCDITRPNGSGEGITELNKNQMDASGDYCVDFARSSRAPNAGSTDAFVKLASDAIGWTHPVISGVASPQPASLTLQNLKDIYTCAVTNWSQIPGGADAPIVAVIPQSGSGTRSTFLGALGISAPGTCVVDPTTGNPIEENTGLSAGNVAQFTGTGAQNDIFPYSIGDWIAQGDPVTGTGTTAPDNATVGGHASPIWGHGNLQQGQVVDDGGIADDAVSTNDFGQPVINPFWLSALTRSLFAVVRNSGTAAAPAFPTTPAYEATALPAIFGPDGFACSAAGESDTVSYGFGVVGDCGTLKAGT